MSKEKKFRENIQSINHVRCHCCPKRIIDSLAKNEESSKEYGPNCLCELFFDLFVSVIADYLFFLHFHAYTCSTTFVKARKTTHLHLKRLCMDKP